jgi:hypothetical protein
MEKSRRKPRVKRIMDSRNSFTKIEFTYKNWNTRGAIAHYAINNLCKKKSTNSTKKIQIVQKKYKKKLLTLITGD